jgi:alpha-tubulin suppressor-like RCC1 family protein
VWTFGDGRNGQLGHGDTQNQTLPKQLENITNIAAIAAGHSHTILLDEQGRVWTFGHGLYGQLGYGDTQNQTLPTQIENIPDIVKVTAGNFHTVLLDDQGQVLTFGDGEFGRLGYEYKIQSRPKQVERIPKIALPANRFTKTKSARKILDFMKSSNLQKSFTREPLFL